MASTSHGTNLPFQGGDISIPSQSDAASLQTPRFPRSPPPARASPVDPRRHIAHTEHIILSRSPTTMAEALTADMMPVPHGFFTRRGGVSTGAFSSLNCSLSSPDDPAAVLENRGRVARTLDTDPVRLLGLTQVHGTRVVTATTPWAPGQGEKADAMVTDRPGLALGIVTADCAPVLFADADRKIVGAAHAGWRGAVAGVLEATIAAMTVLGASPDRITAAVGPCIAQASYEVGPDLRDAVLARSADGAAFFTPGQRQDRWQFD